MRMSPQHATSGALAVLLAGLLAALLVPAGVASAGATQDAPAPGSSLRTADTDVRLDVLSSRPDLVSAGDALVEVVLPAGASANGLRVDVGGRDVSSAFALRTAGSVEGRVVGLITGLRTGSNELRARLADGRGAELVLTNHPRGGPLVSGPQLQPWECTTEANDLGQPDAQCNGETTYRFHYKPVDPALPFRSYDPESPPPAALVATTTTDEGKTVPYIVRVERGTLNRAIYDVAVLFDPAQPMSPWQPQEGWNRKLVYSFGQGCAPGYSQDDPQDPLLRLGLDRGFAVAVSSLNVMGNSCSLHLSGETALMVKERITEQYGEIRYTIGNGCSGGAEGQNSLAENFPGILDGIRPECTFADGWTPAIYSKSDCHLLERYFNQTSPQLWPVASQRAAVIGTNESQCLEMRALGSAPQDWDPTTGCGLSDTSLVYHPETNPTGARCTLQDLHVAQLGRRAGDGFANGVLDDVGVQWGLAAVQAGQITVEQFVDLNEKIGGFTIDYQRQDARTQGDLAGIRHYYEAGEFSWGTNLARTPTIDARSNNTVDFHANIHREIVRNRVKRAGSEELQVYWNEPYTGAFGLPSPQLAERTFVVMDAWLAAIEADTSSDPAHVKAARNKPAEAEDGACYTGAQEVAKVLCDATYETAKLPRLVAGMPETADVLKCQLKPLALADYTDAGIAVTEAQLDRLRTAFPTGVCDYSRPGVGQRAPVGTYLDFADGPGGEPLGVEPVSRPLAGPGAGTGGSGSAPGAGGTASGSLPATGLSAALPLTALVAVGVAAAIRRRRTAERGPLTC
jgi:hypothetical protein